MREIPIIRFPYDCYWCDATVYVTWPFNEEMTSPEPLQLVGEQLRKEAYSFVQVVDGRYATICRNCGARQGDFYIRNEAMAEAHTREPYDYIEVETTESR